MDIHLMVFAAPMFLILISIESIIDYYKQTKLYQFNDSINNFSSGILEEIASLPMRALLIFPYYYIHENFALFKINSHSIFSWFILWVSVDFFYYWYHRASHRITFFWIGHSVHHQSELFNLSVALRQGYFQTLTSWVFYLPIALIGFPTWMFVIVSAINTIYQFWIHTESIRNMGWFEYVFNTPSHHRVHHGTNPQYIDKNYAGSLIIWDKLFGTFEPENESVIYGVTEPLDSWNPFYANIKVVKDVLHYGKKLRNSWNLVRAFFMPPEWIINQLKKENASTEKQIIHAKNQSSPFAYMLFNTAVAVSLYTYLSVIYDPAKSLSWFFGAVILLTLYLLGRVANGNKSIRLFEVSRASFLVLGLHSLQTQWLISISFGILFFVINFILFKMPGAEAESPSLVTT
ncbi:sterol desaturase family protein [Legionella waltersii]|uniref:Sterol desaturase n=1 Tax=Legionella waltersii TaxID=66969 RepID=A0A0W0ZZZ4_9GAMM|nr:sterol desaturase family protein [Legionella waltersii]KTD74667.1 sterol desaturase [Legionella waltersii]SNV09128.1 sterol desaturase [Legionella waltersii]